MRPVDRLLMVLDRTLVLFIGMAVGAAIMFSFVPSPSEAGRAKATTPPVQAAAVLHEDRTSDPLGPRLAGALREGRRIQVGVFGDSFAEGIWSGLYHQLRSDERFEVVRFGERSTGFTRYRSLNLLDDVRRKLDQHPVDIAILSVGANDTQGIYLDGHGNTYMSEGWQRIVAGRMAEIVQLLRSRGVMVYWVGLPKMREAAYDADIRRMSAFHAERLRALGVPYFETASLTTDPNGQYMPYLPTNPRSRELSMARTNDGIHMTIPGYIYLMRGLSDRIRRSVGPAPARNDQAEAPAGPATNSAG